MFDSLSRDVVLLCSSPTLPDMQRPLSRKQRSDLLQKTGADWLVGASLKMTRLTLCWIQGLDTVSVWCTCITGVVGTKVFTLLHCGDSSSIWAQKGGRPFTMTSNKMDRLQQIRYDIQYYARVLGTLDFQIAIPSGRHQISPNQSGIT